MVLKKTERHEGVKALLPTGKGEAETYGSPPGRGWGGFMKACSN